MAMTDKEADRVFDSMLIKLENRLSRKLLSNFSKLSQLIRQVIANGGQFGGNIVILENQRELEQILIQAYEDAIREGIKFTRLDLELEPAEEDNFNEILLLLLGWRIDTAQQHSAFLTSTTIDIFNRVVADQIASGKTGEELDKAVAREVAKQNRRRVGTIATTESNTAFQVGSEREAIQVDDVQLLKRWRSQEDRRVRPTHRSANNRYKANPIPLNELFQVGAGSGARPLDPRLPSDETIGCRCFMRFVKPKPVTENTI